MAAPQRPKAGNGLLRLNGPVGGRKLTTTTSDTDTTTSIKHDILKKVTRNCIVNAVVKKRQITKARDERLGKAKKCKTRAEILAAMDLQELVAERSAMARMGFLDKAEELDRMIDTERKRIKQERERQDQQAQDQKMGGLRMSRTRRTVAMEGAQAAGISALEQKCAGEMEQLKAKQKGEYDRLIEETATKATGGISSCLCTDAFRCRHNKSASYNTRKPSKDVIRLRQNGQRLRASGRLEEAAEMDNMAAAIESRAETRWRETVKESILSSPWCGGKSQLERMVERHQAMLQALITTHTERMARLKQQYSVQRRNLQSTLAVERKKVVLHCRREAIKRRNKDIVEGAKKARNINKHKSNGTQNVSKNMFKDSDNNSGNGFESDDERLEGWKPPTASGVDNSKVLKTYEDIASGNVHKKLADGTFGAEEAGADGLKTSDSRAMDTYRMKQSGVTATFDHFRGGPQVKMGKSAVQPPPGTLPSTNIPGTVHYTKSQSDKGNKENSNDDENDEDDDDDGDDDGDDEDSAESGDKLSAPAKSSPGAAGPRGFLVGVRSPRRPIYNSSSSSPASGYNTSPGRPSGGSPMTIGARGPPMNSPETTYRPASSPFPAVGLGTMPGTLPGGSPGVSPMNIAPRGPAVSFPRPPRGLPRGPLPNNPVSGGDSSVFRGGAQDESSGGSPTGTPGTPRGPAMGILGFPRGPLPSQFPTGGFGASSERLSGASPGGSPMRPPNTPFERPMSFPGRPTSFSEPPDKATSLISLESLGASPVGSPGGLPRVPPVSFDGPPRGQPSFPSPLGGNDVSQTGTSNRQNFLKPTDKNVGDGDRNEKGEDEEEECDNDNEGTRRRVGSREHEQDRLEEVQGGEEQAVEKKMERKVYDDDQCTDSSSADEKAEEEDEADKYGRLPKEIGASRKAIDIAVESSRRDQNDLEVLYTESRTADGSEEQEDDEVEGSRGGRGEKIWEGEKENDNDGSDNDLQGTSDGEVRKDKGAAEDEGLLNEVDGPERGFDFTGDSSPRDVNEFEAWNSDARGAERGWGRDGKDKNPRGGERGEKGEDEERSEGGLESAPTADDELGSEASKDGRHLKEIGRSPVIDIAVGLPRCHVHKKHAMFTSETRGAKRGKEQGDDRRDDVQDNSRVKGETEGEKSDEYKLVHHNLGGSADKHVEDENNVSVNRGNHEEFSDPTEGIDIVGEPLRGNVNEVGTIGTGRAGGGVELEDDQGKDSGDGKREEDEEEEKEDEDNKCEDNENGEGFSANDSEGDGESARDSEKIGDREMIQEQHDKEGLCKAEENDEGEDETNNDYEEGPPYYDQDKRPAPVVSKDQLGSTMTPRGELYAEASKESNGNGASEIAQLHGREFNIECTGIIAGDSGCEETFLGGAECGSVVNDLGNVVIGANLIHQRSVNERKQWENFPNDARNREEGCQFAMGVDFDEANLSSPMIVDAVLQGKGTRNDSGSKKNGSKKCDLVVSTGCPVLTDGLPWSSICNPLELEEKEPRVPVENKENNQQEVEPRDDGSVDIGGDDPSGQDAFSCAETEVGPPTAASRSGEGLPCSEVVPTSWTDSNVSATMQLERAHEKQCRLNLDAPAVSVVVKTQVNEESSNLVEQSLYSSSNEPCYDVTESSSADRSSQTRPATASDGGSIVSGLCLCAESDDGAMMVAHVTATPKIESAIEREGNGAQNCAQAPSNPAIPDVSTICAVSVSRGSKGLEKKMFGDNEEEVEESEESSGDEENGVVRLSSQRCASDKSDAFTMDVPILAFPEAILSEMSENEGDPKALARIGKINGAVKNSPGSEAVGPPREEAPINCQKAAESFLQQIDSVRTCPEDDTNRQKGVGDISVTDLSAPTAGLCKENGDPYNQSDKSGDSGSNEDPASGNASTSERAVGHTTTADKNSGLIPPGSATSGDEWSAITRSSVGNEQMCYDHSTVMVTSKVASAALGIGTSREASHAPSPPLHDTQSGSSMEINFNGDGFEKEIKNIVLKNNTVQHGAQEGNEGRAVAPDSENGRAESRKEINPCNSAANHSYSATADPHRLMTHFVDTTSSMTSATGTGLDSSSLAVSERVHPDDKTDVAKAAVASAEEETAKVEDNVGSMRKDQTSLAHLNATHRIEEYPAKIEEEKKKKFTTQAMLKANGDCVTSYLHPRLQKRNQLSVEHPNFPAEVHEWMPATRFESQHVDNEDYKREWTEGIAFQAKVDLNESSRRGKQVIVRTATGFIGDQTAAKNDGGTNEEGNSKGIADEEDPPTGTFAADGPSANDRACQTSWKKEVGTQTMPSV